MQSLGFSKERTWQSGDPITLGAALSVVENELDEEKITGEWEALKGELEKSTHPLHNNPKDRHPGFNYLVEGRHVTLANGDFIHASEIKLDQFRYIATQAPLRSTIADVWQMVFEQQAPLIVNLVHQFEMDAPTATQDGACAYYWPQNRMSIQLANGLTITHVGERKTENFVERRFKILHTASGKEHQVTHLHDPLWGDGQSTELLKLLALIRRTVELTQGPIVIHCREGIGRSGTFIATHYLLQNPTACAFQIVSQMREQRRNMVGTLDQYRMVSAAELLSKK